MAASLPPVVIDNGSCSTRAGFASEELPSLVFGSNYIKNSSGEILFGAESLAAHPQAEIMTIMEDGVIYDTDAAAKNWAHVYANLDNGNGADSREHALMATEHAWTSGKTRAQLAQVAFEELQVPLFSLVKTPSAQLYHMGRSSGLVVDVGSAVTTVTPVLDGILQLKSSFHSRYAGDFLDLHCLRSIENKLGYSPTQLDYTRLLPGALRASQTGPSASYLSYHVAQSTLGPFKQTMLAVTEAPPGVPNSANYYPSAQRQRPSAYQLPDGTHVHYAEHEGTTLCEPLFVPHAYPLPGLSLPEPTFNHAGSHGVSNLVLFALKNLESAFLASAGDSQGANANARFNEVLRQLLSNTLITGGGALVPGLADRVCGDLSRTAPQVLPGYVVTGSYKLYISSLRNHNTGTINDTFDKKFGAWLGAANLASMLKENTADEAGSVGIALDNWFVSKADYEELGEDLIVEKFK